jgi:hypothetical protein
MIDNRQKNTTICLSQQISNNFLFETFCVPLFPQKFKDNAQMMIYSFYELFKPNLTYCVLSVFTAQTDSSTPILRIKT